MTQHARDRAFGPAGEVETRYRRARQEWDRRLGHTIVQAHNWRLAAFASMAVALVSVVGLIVQSTRADVVPYLVEVEATGQVRLVGEVTTQDWSLSQSARRVELERWIQNLRSVSTDERVMTERFAHVRTHATAAANLQLDALFEREDPWAAFGREARTVHIESVTTLPGSEQAYRVTWREDIFDDSGRERGARHYIGEFHLSIVPPTTRGELEDNPLGVYVSFFDFDLKR